MDLFPLGLHFLCCLSLSLLSCLAFSQWLKYCSQNPQKVPMMQETKVSWRIIVRWRPCIPNVSKAPPYLFRSAHGVSRVHTQVHANTDALRKKEKRKVSSSPLKAGTLKQLLWMAGKQWSAFHPPVKRRCQVAGAWCCVEAGRGWGEEGCAFVGLW